MCFNQLKNAYIHGESIVRKKAAGENERKRSQSTSNSNSAGGRNPKVSLPSRLSWNTQRKNMSIFYGCDFSLFFISGLFATQAHLTNLIQNTPSLASCDFFLSFNNIRLKTGSYYFARQSCGNMKNCVCGLGGDSITQSLLRWWRHVVTHRFVRMRYVIQVINRQLGCSMFTWAN